jgi:hypothetical protein
VWCRVLTSDWMTDLSCSTGCQTAGREIRASRFCSRHSDRTWIRFHETVSAEIYG